LQRRAGGADTKRRKQKTAQILPYGARTLFLENIQNRFSLENVRKNLIFKLDKSAGTGKSALETKESQSFLQP
jgi:hypothetical protein